MVRRLQDAEKIHTDGELAPGLCQAHADGSKQGEDGGDEDGMATTEKMIEGIGDPCSARK